jgi:hypothetical protein
VQICRWLFLDLSARISREGFAGTARALRGTFHPESQSTGQYEQGKTRKEAMGDAVTCGRFFPSCFHRASPRTSRISEGYWSLPTTGVAMHCSAPEVLCTNSDADALLL